MGSLPSDWRPAPQQPDLRRLARRLQLIAFSSINPSLEVELHCQAALVALSICSCCVVRNPASYSNAGK